MSTASIIKAARKGKGLKLRQLESLSGISNSYLSQLENGKISRPSAVSLYKLASILEIDFDSLMVEHGFVDPINETNYIPDLLMSMKVNRIEERELMVFLTHLRTINL